MIEKNQCVLKTFLKIKVIMIRVVIKQKVKFVFKKRRKYVPRGMGRRVIALRKNKSSKARGAYSRNGDLWYIKKYIWTFSPVPGTKLLKNYWNFLRDRSVFCYF